MMARARLPPPPMSQRSYSDLPDAVLFHIFGYFTPEERWRNARICSRWYNVARSPVFWKDVDIPIETPFQILKLLPHLPASVKHLRLSCHSVNISQPLYFPEFMWILHDRCPHLKTLILEKVFLPELSEVTNKETEEPCALEMYPKELRVLSLRTSLFVTELLSSRLVAFIPRIRVLDFSHSLCITDEIVPFFSSLDELEELYLLGCPITGSGIANLLKAVKNLKVLDLESTGIHSSTFSDLKEFGQRLEKLYLAKTLVDDSFLDFDSQAVLFQRLQTLCLRSTYVSPDGVEKLVMSCHSLESVIVTMCNVSEIWSKDRYKHIRNKLIYEDTQSPRTHLPYCNHFEKNNCHRR